jgi:hypothetical protein
MATVSQYIGFIMAALVVLMGCGNISPSAVARPAQNTATLAPAGTGSSAGEEDGPPPPPERSTSTPGSTGDVGQTSTTEIPTLEPDSGPPQTEDAEVAQILNQVNQQISDDKGGSYFLIQFQTRLNSDLHQELNNAGVVLYDPLENNVYQAYIPAGALPFLETLLNQGDIVTISLIPAQTKIKSPLNDSSRLNPQASYQIIVQFFNDPGEVEKAMLEEKMTVNEYAQGVMNFAQGQALGENLGSIAELSFVKSIEEIVPASGGGN